MNSWQIVSTSFLAHVWNPEDMHARQSNALTHLSACRGHAGKGDEQKAYAACAHAGHQALAGRERQGVRALVPGEAGELGAGDHLGSGAVLLHVRVGQHVAVVVQRYALRHARSREHRPTKTGTLWVLSTS